MSFPVSAGAPRRQAHLVPATARRLAVRPRNRRRFAMALQISRPHRSAGSRGAGDVPPRAARREPSPARPGSRSARACARRPRRPGSGPHAGTAAGLAPGGTFPARPRRVRDHPGRVSSRWAGPVAVRRHQHLLPAPAVALHDRQRAQRRRRDVARGGPGLGVRRRLGRQLHGAAAEALRVRRRRVRLAGLRHLQGRPARPAAGARAGEQLARLRRHGAVRDLVPRACPTTPTAPRPTTTCSTAPSPSRTATAPT